MAAIDTARWPLELCCKAITQHLTIKTCVGLSENAVMSPIWVALITSLMRAFVRFQAGLSLSCQQTRRLLRINRFDTRTLVD